MEMTTKNPVGARRRPYEGTLFTGAIESSPPAAHSAETSSVWLDASAAEDHPLTTTSCPVIQGQLQDRLSRLLPILLLHPR